MTYPEDHELLLIVFCRLYGPVILIGLVLLYWSRNSRTARLSVVLKRSAIFLLISLGIVVVLNLVVLSTCSDPDAAYSRCLYIPDYFGRNMVPIGIFSYFAAVLYITALFIVGAIIEFLVWLNRPSPSSTP